MKTGALARSGEAAAKSGEAAAKSGEATAKAAKSELGLIEQEIDLLRQQSDAARLQSEVAEQALNASVQPLLLDVPLYTMRKLPRTMSDMLAQRNMPAHEREADKEIDASAIWWDVHDGSGRMTVPVRNVGAGVARLTAAVLSYAREDAVGVPLVPGDLPSVIAPGELDWIRFEWIEHDEERPLEVMLDADDELVIEVAYSDLSGRQEAATALYLVKSGRTDRTHRVRDVSPGVARRWTSPPD